MKYTAMLSFRMIKFLQSWNFEGILFKIFAFENRI